MNVLRQSHPNAANDVAADHDRLEWAARLRRRALVKAERDGTTVRLWYAAAFQDEVRRWVNAQAVCTPWLDFTLHRLPSGVMAMTVLADVRRRGEVEELFVELSGLD